MLFKGWRIPLVCTLSLTHQAAAIETVHRVIVCSVTSATERTGPVLFTPPKRTRTTSHYHPNDCRYEIIVQQNFNTIVTIGKGETMQNCARSSDEPVSSHRKLLGVSHTFLQAFASSILFFLPFFYNTRDVFKWILSGWSISCTSNLFCRNWA